MRFDRRLADGLGGGYRGVGGAIRRVSRGRIGEGVLLRGGRDFLSLLYLLKY